MKTEPNESVHEWIEQRLQRRVSGGGTRLVSLWSGYGEIRRYELLPLTGRAPPLQDAAGSVIVKVMRPPSAGRPREISHARKLRSYEVEARFYANFAAALPGECRTPLYWGRHNAASESWLLLEDLDAAGYFERRSQVTTAERSACLEWLAHFHATFLGRKPEGLWKTGTYWHLATRPDELAALGQHPLRSAARAIDEQLSRAQYQTWVHGDAKLENFCFQRRGGLAPSVAAVDFQYVGGGVGMKDLAYFLGCCVAPGRAETELPPLIAEYFRLLSEALRLRGQRDAAFTWSANDFAALEHEWRALFPLAWVDLYRFLLGWGPDYVRGDTYSEKLTREVLQGISPPRAG